MIDHWQAAQWDQAAREEFSANMEFYGLWWWHRWLKTPRYRRALARKQRAHKRAAEVIGL